MHVYPFDHGHYSLNNVIGYLYYTYRNTVHKGLYEGIYKRRYLSLALSLSLSLLAAMQRPLLSCHATSSQQFHVFEPSKIIASNIRVIAAEHKLQH